jgi:thioredoxin-like negative regulator of GroEL
MNLTFNTEIAANISVVLKALELYQNRQFQQAIEPLLDVLDTEPKNWDARLMLAACYYKTDQFAAAERAFRLITEQSRDLELRSKARHGLQVISAKRSKRGPELPPEWGCTADQFAMPEASWLF